MAAPLKRCLVRRRDGREQHGLAASCLRELRDKGEEEEGGTHGDRPGTAGLYASPGGGKLGVPGGLPCAAASWAGSLECPPAVFGRSPIRAVELDRGRAGFRVTLPDGGRRREVGMRVCK